MSNSLSDMTLEELQAFMEALGEPKYRAAQVYSWLCKGIRPSQMSNISKSLRERLSLIPFGGAGIYDTRISEKDGTRKYLFELEDGNLVEGVLMRYHYGNTLCISTQVGCRMGCAFCASTLEGCVRNLSAGEMQSFISCVETDVPHAQDSVRTVTNIVLMGSGEPLDNYEQVVKFLKMVTAEDGKNISARNISLSTCGLVPMIYRLMEDAPHVTLSISLHAPNDTIRNQIMPISKKYSMDELLEAAKSYADGTGRRVIFEYALIGELNSDKAQAFELADRLRGINCHVNLIPLNPVKERNLNGVTRKQAEQFAAWLDMRHISATIRREMGADIQGACGQLRRSVLMEKGERQQ